MPEITARNATERTIVNTASGLRLFPILAVVAFLSLNLLLVGNMGSANEVDVLPLAKQFASPNWMPKDWYLNQPPSYRLLFQSIFGWLAEQWGFLATSISGRLLSYGLVASGLVSIARRLNLSLPLLLLAISLFLAKQSVAADEWLISALEAKSLAYGFVLLAIDLMLAGRYLWMAGLFGIATSFHVLVGGWAFLTALGWLALKPNLRLQGIRRFGLILLCYLVGSIFALQAISQQLFSSTSISVIAPSFIYVFLRLPHHLYPFAWSSKAWIAIAFYLIVFGASVTVLRYQRSDSYPAQMKLAEFTVISLVPFVLGLAIAPFDSEGKLLQYYPFRFGDVMLPLSTALLFVCAVKQIFDRKGRRVLMLVSVLILSAILTVQSFNFKDKLLNLQQFPNVQQEISSEWKELCAWVNRNTAKDAVLLVPPDSWFAAFTWLTERSTVVNFKLLPQTKTGIIDWYQRLDDLSGRTVLQQAVSKRTLGGWNLSLAINAAYLKLTTPQVKALMTQYKANYLVTKVSHRLALPVAYRNQNYIVYTKRS
ncbi:MAG: hypothetical protein KME10_18085 [Plectolyngbya sp. WJT66-NPBG17]|jgi:hypothetical protein|nr:hypothetical protein [Plectolyngbya sp. WJT66-NPBG17]MBW4525126.1 hypothetical protein [Phormidium tanganyikae FI6-MK23]